MGTPTPPPGSGVTTTPYAADNRYPTADSLRPLFKEWARMAHSGEKLNDAQQKLLDDMTEMLARHGVFSSQDSFNAVAKGTEYDGQALDHVLSGVGDGNADVSGILNSVSNRNQSTVSTNTRTGTEVNYIDLPTPEEFLDDFNVGYGIHLSGLVQTGAIRPEVAAFARDNAATIFNNYLRERVARLLKGEPLYKVVGTNADNKLIGSRTGQQADTHDIGNEQVSGTQTTSGAAAPVGGSAADSTAAADAVGGLGTLTYNDINKTDQTNKTRMDEALVQRNKLGIVSNLSPLDYLKDAASAQSLNLLYEGEKGTSARERQTVLGGESFATRRI